VVSLPHLFWVTLNLRHIVWRLNDRRNGVSQPEAKHPQVLLTVLWILCQHHKLVEELIEIASVALNKILTLLLGF
jgi:hypothetical protein